MNSLLTTVNITGLPFVLTPAGYVAETLLTRGQLAAIVERPIPHPNGAYTLEDYRAGHMVMDNRTGAAHVLSRAPNKNDAARISRQLPLSNDRFVYNYDRWLVPALRTYADPNFANHPLVDIQWFHGAAIASALTDMQEEWIIRLLTSEEYDRIVLCDGEMTEDEVLKIAHIDTGEVIAVIGDAANRRANKWGLVDFFGNVRIWVSNLHNPAHLAEGKSLTQAPRIIRGVSAGRRSASSPELRVGHVNRSKPGHTYGSVGVRFIAERRVSP